MKSRFLFVISLLLAFTLVISACAPAATEEPVDDVEVPEVEETEEEAQIRAALLTPNPLGDRSFIDSSARGIDQANQELPVEADIIETQGIAEHEAALRSAIAEGYDLLLPLAFDAELLLTIAEEFPEQKFASPSEVFADVLPSNLLAFQINVHESSFLAGLIAGFFTETNTVGAVVGGDSPALNQFFYGYKQGVLETCPDCEVLVSYLGFDFSNPTLGKETAAAQYDQGADIVFQIAGRSGEGVLAAAAERDLYAIGVDSNQDFVAPGNVIVSMIKRVDITTYLPIEMVLEGTFEGGFQELGMADGAAGLSWDEGSTTFEEEGPPEMTAKMDEIKDLVEDFRAQVLAGDYTVCNALTDPDLASEACAPLK